MVVGVVGFSDGEGNAGMISYRRGVMKILD